MKVRALITLLLVFCLGATHVSAGARFGEREPLAPRDERESREFAEAFFKRLEEGQDFAPLVGEMFVGDFAERLHASAGSAGSLYFLDRSAAASASRDEVLRHYVAVNNLLLLTSIYMMDAQLSARAAKADDGKQDGETAATGEAQATEESDEDEEADLKVENILPPEVLELFKADPLLGHFVLDPRTSEAARQGSATDDADEFITTAEQLRAFTATVERANELLRRRLTGEQKKRFFGEWRRAAEEKDSELMRPYAAVVEKEWYGFPAGTRLVCVSLLIFHIELVRVGGGYKATALYLSDD